MNVQSKVFKIKHIKLLIYSYILEKKRNKINEDRHNCLCYESICDIIIFPIYYFLRLIIRYRYI